MRYAIKFQHDDDSGLPSLAEVMSRSAENSTITARSAYHYLTNIDEFPEMLPLAYQLVCNAIASSKDSHSLFPADFYNAKWQASAFQHIPQHLTTYGKSFALDTLISGDSVNHHQDYLALQLAPTMLVAGSWLQNFSRVATAHTAVGSLLNKIFSVQTMAYAAADLHHENRPESAFLKIFTLFHQSPSIRSLAVTDKTENDAFELPLLLLGFGQFPREFLPELLGLNLAWYYLGIHAFVENITLETMLGCNQTKESRHQLKQRNDLLEELSLNAIKAFHNEQTSADQIHVQGRILCGMEILASTWMKWLECVKKDTLGKRAYAESEMLELVQRKGPYAMGYHRNKKLGGHKIDDLLNGEKFKSTEILDYLAHSPYIVAGDGNNSPFTTTLVELGGPMAGVFTREELTIIRHWIDGLDKTGKQSPKVIPSDPPTMILQYPVWERAGFLEESRQLYANRPCSLRELYYKLVNVEYFPDVLPVAEQFLIDRLNRSRSTLTTGERPLPAMDYSHAVLEKWVFDKHRQQVDAYQPLTGRPRISREDFIKATAGLAPLLLVDGGWLQGATALHTLHTPVGLKLYRIFFEELGEGMAEHHHANIYRELLESMGVNFPDVTDLGFAFSDQLPDSAFEVPVLWLSLSCFTRHYFPELLGINLAVELAGVGAGYMEAHDTLKYYGFPTTFVDFHNSSDNASVGHSAWALNTIKTYMQDVATREGHQRLNAHWHRLWAGMRLTLPTSSDFYWSAT